MSTDKSTSVPPSPKVFRRLLQGGSVLLIVILLTFVGGRFYLTDARLQQMIQDLAQKEAGISLQIESISLSLLSGISLNGLRVKAPQGFTKDVVYCHTIQAGWSAFALLTGSIVVDEVVVHGCTLTYEEKHTKNNMDALMAKLKPKEGGSLNINNNKKVSKTNNSHAQNPFQQPNIPIRIAIEEINIEAITLLAFLPQMDISLEQIGVNGHLFAEGKKLNIDLWMGLGANKGNGTQSTLQVIRHTTHKQKKKQRKQQRQQQLTLKQSLGITLKIQDLAHIDLAIKHNASLNVTTQKADNDDKVEWPTLQINGDLALTLDLFSASLELPKCRWQLGQNTFLSIALEGHNLLTDPQIALTEMVMETQLEEWQGVLNLLAPGTQSTGTIALNMTPLSGPLNTLKDPLKIDTTLTANIKNLTINTALPQNKKSPVNPATLSVQQLNNTLTLHLANGELEINNSLAFKKIIHTQEIDKTTHTLQGFGQTFQLTTPIAPFLPTFKKPSVNNTAALLQNNNLLSPHIKSTLNTTIQSIQNTTSKALKSANHNSIDSTDRDETLPTTLTTLTEARLERLNIAMALSVPVVQIGQLVPLVQNKQVALPPIIVETTVTLPVIMIRQTGQSIAPKKHILSGFNMAHRFALYDIKGDHLESDLTLRQQQIRLGLPKGEMTVPPLQHHHKITVKNKKTLTFEQFDYRVGHGQNEIISGHLSGTVTLLKNSPKHKTQNTKSNTVSTQDKAQLEIGLNQWVATIDSLNISNALSLLPNTMRPPVTASGIFSSRIDCHGILRPVQLSKIFTPPKVSLETHWKQGIAAYEKYLDKLSAVFYDHHTSATTQLPFTLSASMALHNFSFREHKKSSPLMMTELNQFGKLSLSKNGLSSTMSIALGRLESGPNKQRMILEELRFTANNTWQGRQMDFTGSLKLERLTNPMLTQTVAVNLGWDAGYLLGGDFTLKQFWLGIPTVEMLFTTSALMVKPLRTAAARAWEKAYMPGVELTSHWVFEYGNKKLQSLTVGGPQTQGHLQLSGDVALNNGLLHLSGNYSTDGLAGIIGANSFEGMRGTWPFDIQLAFWRGDDVTPLPKSIPFGGGFISLVTSAEDVRTRPPQPVYFERLRPYRKTQGLFIEGIYSGPYAIHNMQLEGGLRNGILAIDHMSMEVLGGDIDGEFLLQLSRQRELIGEMTLQVSNIDASYFKELSLSPGPESELSYDFRLGYRFAPKGRDLEMNMNVTKIGSSSLDRFLQLLDPEEKDAKLQKNRANLKFVTINHLATWIRYENLNIDIDYTTKMGPIPLPFIKMIPNEMLRRSSINGHLDYYLQPMIDRLVAPALGWPPRN